MIYALLLRAHFASDVGEFEGGDFHHAGDVEVESLGTLAGDGLHLDVVDASVQRLVFGGNEPQEVDDVIFVLWSDNNPRLLFGAATAGHDGSDETVKSILAHGRTCVFFLLLEDVDVEVHLVHVEHVVVERLFSIFLDAVTLGT